jgi:molybdopterin converting factor small subunit
VSERSVRVLIPTPLRSYTQDAAVVAADGATLAGVLADLDRRYPGLRFRVIDEQGSIRRHIKFFINGAAAASLEPPLQDADEVMIVCALSGG